MSDSASPRTLQDYLSLPYRFDVVPDPEGGYVIEYPDLPGCMTQVETAAEIGAAAAEIRELWLEAAFEQDVAIPLPSHPEEHSGRFNLRLPKSLHRRLAEQARAEGVSLNQHVVTLLASGAESRGIEAVLRSLVEEMRQRQEVKRSA
jgi:antitoxin HicB